MGKQVRIIQATKNSGVNNKLRVAAYCRVSTDSEDQANSFFAQVTYYNDYIRANSDMYLVDIYADEGITGTEIEKRDEFKRLISDVKKKKIDRVLVKSVTRFARNSLECIETVRLFKSCGVTVFFENDNIDTAQMNSEMMLYIKSAFAQSEALSASRRMAVSVRMRMADGTFNLTTAPYGYRLVNNELVVVPEEAENVKTIFNLYLNGMGSYLIAEYMRERDGAAWNYEKVRYILSNEKYIGDCLLQKSFVENVLPFRKKINRGQLPKYYCSGTHEPIIDKEVFYRVQAIMSERKGKFSTPMHGANKKYAFHNKIYCRHCGWVYRTVKCNDGIRWRCSRQGLTKESCFTPVHTDDEVRAAFVKMFNILKHYENIIVHETILQLQTLKMKANGGNMEIEEIDRELSSLSEQNRIYADLYAEHILDEISYYEQTDGIKNKITELRSRRFRLLSSDEDEECLENLRKLERVLAESEYITEFDEELFNSLVEKIYAEENGDLTFILKCGLESRTEYSGI